MRFKEIANPADQLALWKLISDKMWAAFDEPVPRRTNTPLPLPRTAQGRAASPANQAAKAVPCSRRPRFDQLEGIVPIALRPDRSLGTHWSN